MKSSRNQRAYKYIMRGSTSFSNLFMAGDWIINQHEPCLQEKSYVFGVEAVTPLLIILKFCQNHTSRRRSASHSSIS